MASYNTNEFKSGLKVMLDGDPSAIIENTFVKPGKGQAFNRVKFRNLKTGRVLEKTYKSGESIEAADVVELEMQYLYNDGEQWYFMEQDTFEQHAAGKTAMAEARLWLKGEERCAVTLWNNEPLSVSPPNFVILRITETGPGRRQASHAGDRRGGQGAAVCRAGRIVEDRHPHGGVREPREGVKGHSRLAKSAGAGTQPAGAVRPRQDKEAHSG